MEATSVTTQPVRRRRIISTLAIVVASTIGVTGFSVTAVHATSVSVKSTELPTFGDNGSSVVRLQQALVARGFTLKGGISGNFDGATRYTLRALQKVAGFRATGVLDEKTAKFLGLVNVAPLATDNLPKVGMSGDYVWSLQQALINNGVTLKGGADGKFGLATTIALGKFQAAKGLSVSKVLDKSTAVALGLLAAPAPVVTAVAKPVVSATPSAFPQSGERSDAVRDVQQALLRNGITVNGGADGIYGRATIAALAAFQGRRNLPANGIMDEPTAVALGLLAAPAPVVTAVAKPVVSATPSAFPQSGERSDAVRDVQQALLRNGITVNGGADGIYGRATIAALAAFQGRRNLPANGIMDEPTAVALGLGNKPVATVSTPVAPVVGQLTIGTLPTMGQRSEAVRMVQNALIAKGVEVKGGADGVFGVATAISIGKFQESQNIPVSKTLDVRTGIALGVLPSVESMGITAIKVFPVQGPCSFTDTWLEPRSGGRLHLGVDITAARGKALYAVVDGVISQVTAGGALTGNGLRLAQPDGTYFFYAHMDSFAPGIAVGTPVRAGQIIGYVGSSGNAGGPHLHFEVHPFGGDAVTPYPVVKVVDACNVTEVLPQS